jgi:hypothetical protein
MKSPGEELAAVLVFDQEMAPTDAECVELWAHRIDLALHEAREAGKRIGHDQVLRHVRERLSMLSHKHETQGTPDTFRAVEECCADMRKLAEQYGAVPGGRLDPAKTTH